MGPDDQTSVSDTIRSMFEAVGSGPTPDTQATVDAVEALLDDTRASVDEAVAQAVKTLSAKVASRDTQLITALNDAVVGEVRRITSTVADHTAGLSDQLATLTADLDASRQERSRLHEQVASTVAEQAAQSGVDDEQTQAILDAVSALKVRHDDVDERRARQLAGLADQLAQADSAAAARADTLTATVDDALAAVASRVDGALEGLDDARERMVAQVADDVAVKVAAAADERHRQLSDLVTSTLTDLAGRQATMEEAAGRLSEQLRSTVTETDARLAELADRLEASADRSAQIAGEAAGDGITALSSELSEFRAETVTTLRNAADDLRAAAELQSRQAADRLDAATDRIVARADGADEHAADVLGQVLEPFRTQLDGQMSQAVELLTSTNAVSDEMVGRLAHAAREIDARLVQMQRDADAKHQELADRIVAGLVEVLSSRQQRKLSRTIGA